MQEIELALEKTVEDLSSLYGRKEVAGKADAATATSVADATLLSTSESSMDQDGDISPLASYDSMKDAKVGPIQVQE